VSRSAAPPNVLPLAAFPMAGPGDSARPPDDQRFRRTVASAGRWERGEGWPTCRAATSAHCSPQSQLFVRLCHWRTACGGRRLCLGVVEGAATAAIAAKPPVTRFDMPIINAVRHH
jgi:hypothetical protein